MPEEAGRHRNYWQGIAMNPDGKEISQSRRTERGRSRGSGVLASKMGWVE